MSKSKKNPPQIEGWTKEEVQQWLTGHVRIPPTYAHKLLEEEISGEELLLLQKQDLLDMEIKHGPAVKILSHLKDLKAGLKRSPRCPAYVEQWTKEQVHEWLLQHLEVYYKYAERLLAEEVSGDCLICFQKEDFKELEIKRGPALKIISSIDKLNSTPEPQLDPPILPVTAQHEEQPAPPTQGAVGHVHCGHPETHSNSSAKAQHSEAVDLSEKTPTLTKDEPQNSQAPGTEKMPPSKVSKLRTLLQNTLEDLQKEELKKFTYSLLDAESARSYKRLSRSQIEDKSCSDIADLMLRHFDDDSLGVTARILKEITRNDLVLQLKNAVGQKKITSDSKVAPRREGNQGEKLKGLLTCGGNTMDNYDRFVVVLNKSQAGQLEYLQFLTKLKLFCVLDFDPNSAATGGVCHSYRNSRVANLHSPAQFQGDTNVVVKNLNLYKQTSWVFCNGRHDIDLDLESNRELDHRTWMRKACKVVEELVTFLCKPEVLLSRRTLVIFLLLSPVQSEKDPFFETYYAFLKNEKEESTITICESESTFTKWRDLIQSKCDSDISRQSIYELTLSEVNGTIMALGPHNQSSGRLLPSSNSGYVVLKQKDEDYMTALDILCQNQCENVYDETTTEFQDSKMKVEEEFFRGGKVKWWNFYFCEKRKAKPFIRRDKYSNLKTLIKTQTKDCKNTCVLLNLFHHPGCGGTTLAMHVMWDLRKTFRCAVLKDNSLPKVEIANQVKKLMKLESEKPTPVLLLVDDSKEAENTQNLVKCIHKAVVEDSRGEEDLQNSQVIILNCVRSSNPMDQYRQFSLFSQYITTFLTQKEQDDFEEKLQELKETHKKPENFYSFMIMKSNFDEEYIAGLVRNTLKNFDINTKKAKLFAFLALLNTYVAESDISLSLTEDFLGMKMISWHKDSVLQRMEPYSNLLIIDTIEDLGGYKGIRILHHSIASACLEEFDKSYHFTVSQIVMEMLHCDLFFKTGVVKDNLMISIQRMLIERQRKKDGDERETFSPLIEKIHNQQGRQSVQEIFVKASSRFFVSASIPQALARYLYIKERDFIQAVIWAENARKIKENPYTVDTIGQVYKSHLKQNIQNEKLITCDPDVFEANLQLASKAIKAFQRAQVLTNNEDESDNDSEDYPTKSYNIFGYVGEMEVTITVVEMLSKLSFFEETDPIKKKYMQSFLKGTLPITSIPKTDNEINKMFAKIIQDHEHFLLELKTQLKRIFEVFDCYFTYIKGNDPTSTRGNSPGEYEARNRRKISDYFTNYMKLLCSSPEEIAKERKSNPKLNLNIDIEERRMYLEQEHADTFAGVLQHLDRDAKKIEKITDYYAFLQPHTKNPKQKTKQKICYILSNIILHLLNSKSVHVKSEKELIIIVKEILQDVGLQHPYPDPYYIAMLLYWPKQGAEDTDIVMYINAIRKASRGRLFFLFRKRSTVAHFYLGKLPGLARLVPKPKLDECFAKIARNELAQLWRSGDIFKEKEIINRLLRVSGTIELGEVFAIYSQQKISVRPAYLGGIRSGFSTEKVSFYIGFAIDGPLAYDIRYEN